MSLDNIRIVLCRPEGSINIGSVCRAMKTMGLSRLYIVNPQRNLEKEWIRNMAVHAYEIYEKAEFPESLAEALEGCALSAGITRRRGTKRKFFSHLPEEFAAKALSLEGEAALVFGNERNGLKDDELACCNAAVHIPSNPDYPSLNLSHAVQVMTAALWRESAGERVAKYTPISDKDREAIVDTIHTTLDCFNYFQSSDPDDIDAFFRDILARAALSKKEARVMENIFMKIRYM
ncbi:MAG: RNA methyltransferase [Spirochaetales bacterium]|nr:RNA methyltransferase [Spirochaetales bacterium]